MKPQNSQSHQKYWKVLKIVASILIGYLFLTSVFNREIYHSAYRDYFLVIDGITIIIAIAGMIVYFLLKKK
jgi:hypothetical protein